MLLFISSVHSFSFIYPIPDITGRLEFISQVTDRKAGLTQPATTVNFESPVFGWWGRAEVPGAPTQIQGAHINCHRKAPAGQWT